MREWIKSPLAILAQGAEGGVVVDHGAGRDAPGGAGPLRALQRRKAPDGRDGSAGGKA